MGNWASFAWHMFYFVSEIPVMPKTHIPEISAENRYLFSGVSGMQFGTDFRLFLIPVFGRLTDTTMLYFYHAYHFIFRFTF